MISSGPVCRRSPRADTIRGGRPYQFRPSPWGLDLPELQWATAAAVVAGAVCKFLPFVFLCDSVMMTVCSHASTKFPQLKYQIL